MRLRAAYPPIAPKTIATTATAIVVTMTLTPKFFKNTLAHSKIKNLQGLLSVNLKNFSINKRKLSALYLFDNLQQKNF